MKKYKKSSVFIGIIAIFVLLIGVFTVNAQSKNNNSSDENAIGYTVKSIYDKKEDGWLYGFEIVYVTDDSSINYIFDGYNLKHIPSDTEYYVSYKDMETGKEIERIPSKYATLSTSAKYRDDIKKINNFFNKKKFTNSITLNDLSDLNIDNISKDYLVDIFNRTIESETKTTPGDYLNAPSLEWKTQKSTDEQNPGEWQVMYITDYGYIYDIEIEFIRSDKSYLSEKQSSSISNKDAVLLDNIENLEKSIVENQSVSTELLKEDNNLLEQNPDLNNLLESLHKDISK